MLSLKDDSVRPGGNECGLIIAIFVVRDVYRELGYDCIITSMRDGKHGTTSLHYADSALDIRTRHMSLEHQEEAASRIRKRLNRHYDVILEPTHIHIEFQPRAGA